MEPLLSEYDIASAAEFWNDSKRMSANTALFMSLMDDIGKHPSWSKTAEPALPGEDLVLTQMLRFLAGPGHIVTERDAHEIHPTKIDVVTNQYLQKVGML